MKYIVWGTSRIGIEVVNTLHRLKEEVIAIVDNDPLQQRGQMQNVKQYSFDEICKVMEWEKVCILISTINSRNVFQILEQIEKCGCLNIGVVKASMQIRKFREKISIVDDFVIWGMKDGVKKNIIPRIEVNLVDGCNLKCKGCTHFSSIFPEESICSIQQYEKDLTKINNTGQLVRLRLLGGEPLLLQDRLIEYILIARGLFPYADIELVTNGLLIPKSSNALLDLIHKMDIAIIVSPYQPTIKMSDKIVNILETRDIMWRFDGEEIEKFCRNLTLKNIHDPEKTSRTCFAYGCTFLRNGKLYKCPFDGLIEELCRHYDIEPIIFSKGVDIELDKIELYSKIRELALYPVEMCQYCSEELEMIPWKVKNSPRLEDWLYKEDSQRVVFD